MANRPTRTQLEEFKQLMGSKFLPLRNKDIYTVDDVKKYTLNEIIQVNGFGKKAYLQFQQLAAEGKIVFADRDDVLNDDEFKKLKVIGVRPRVTQKRGERPGVADYKDHSCIVYLVVGRQQTAIMDGGDLEMLERWASPPRAERKMTATRLDDADKDHEGIIRSTLSLYQGGFTAWPYKLEWYGRHNIFVDRIRVMVIQLRREYNLQVVVMFTLHKNSVQPPVISSLKPYLKQLA